MSSRASREDLVAYRERARTWLETVPIPSTPLELGERFRVLQQWQRQLYEAGWMGIHWPTEFGGQGLTPLHHLTFYEELARVGAPPPVGLIGLDVVGPSIIQYGSDEQRRRLIPPMLSGDEVWCQGFSEPDAGSDLASLRTRAEPRGESFIITGQKVWTSWAHEAAWCAVLARTDASAPKHQGISYLLVPMDRPGITVRPLVQMTGNAEFSEVHFDEVEVPAGNVLGSLNDGWRLALHTLSSERSIYALRRRVELEAAFRDLTRNLPAPGAGGLPRTALADIGASVVALRALEAQTGRTVERLQADLGPTPMDSMDKLLLTGVEQEIFSALFGLLGAARMATGLRPYGLDAERVTHGYLESRAASIYGGTSQIQRNIIAERQLGLPKEK